MNGTLFHFDVIAGALYRGADNAARQNREIDMTLQEARWAACHLWFVECCQLDTGGFNVVVKQVVVSSDLKIHTSYPTFSDYNALRVWAGYDPDWM